MKLVESTRSTSPSASVVCSQGAQSSPRPALVARRLALMGLHDRVDPAPRLLGAPAAVPDQREVAAGAQDAAEFAQRARAVEPVKRLRDGDQVGARVAKRQRFGAPRERSHAADALLEGRSHRCDRLDRDHLSARRRQRARQLPGPGADIDDREAGPEPCVLGKPLERGRGIAWTAALVGVGAAPEAPLGRLVHVAHRDPQFAAHAAAAASASPAGREL
jgi:hypothetical protein